MNGCRSLVDAEPTFAVLGLRLRLELAAILTEAARAWIDAPGIDRPCRAAAGATPSPADGADGVAGVVASPAEWHIESARAPGDPHRLRAVIAETLPPAAFVTAAFRAVLGRAPDPVGLAHFSAWLDHDPAGHHTLLESLVVSPEAAGRCERFRFVRVPTPAGGF